MIALALDEDRKDRPFLHVNVCARLISTSERWPCHQPLRVPLRIIHLCPSVLVSLVSLSLPSSSHHSLASRIQEFNRHTRVVLLRPFILFITLLLLFLCTCIIPFHIQCTFLAFFLSHFLECPFSCSHMIKLNSLSFRPDVVHYSFFLPKPPFSIAESAF